MRAGVLGHVEWVDFAVVDALPAPGAILHAREHFAEAAGVADHVWTPVEIAKLLISN